MIQNVYIFEIMYQIGISLKMVLNVFTALAMVAIASVDIVYCEIYFDYRYEAVSPLVPVIENNFTFYYHFLLS